MSKCSGFSHLRHPFFITHFVTTCSCEFAAVPVGPAGVQSYEESSSSTSLQGCHALRARQNSPNGKPSPLIQLRSVSMVSSCSPETGMTHYGSARPWPRASAAGRPEILFCLKDKESERSLDCGVPVGGLTIRRNRGNLIPSGGFRHLASRPVPLRLPYHASSFPASPSLVAGRV